MDIVNRIPLNPGSFSPLDRSTPVTNQKSSGRCWLFATCNVVRVGIVKKFNLGILHIWSIIRTTCRLN